MRSPSRSALVPFAALVLSFPAAAAADCPGMEIPVLAGLPDDFAYPTEPTQQSPAFADFLTNYWLYQGDRIFDEVGYNLALGHSFTGWMGAVCGATLEFHARADGSQCTNDSIRLAYTGSTIPADGFVYWITLGPLHGSDWTAGSVATFTLDLANLPPYGGFPTDVLPELQDGELELLVEDDTSVDYAVLRVCLCTIDVDPGTWGRVKAKYRDAE
jgi:hypothetical protein